MSRSSFPAKSLRGRDREEKTRSVKLQKDRSRTCVTMFSFTYAERKCIISYRVVEIYGDGSVHNSCFCSILSGIILGYVEKCFRDRGLPSSFLFFLDNREKNIPSFLPPGRAYRGSNARHPCSMAIYAVTFALFFGTRDGKVAFIYIHYIEIW